MAYSNLRNALSFVAAADLSSHQFKIVELASTEKQCRLAEGGEGFGVLQNHPESGEHATVMTDGETKVIAGAALAYGNYVTAKSGGWAIPVNSGDVPPLLIMGRVMTAAASGGIATVHISRMLAHNVVSGSIAAALP